MSRRAEPVRGQGPVFGARREQVIAECGRLEDDLRRLDDELDRLAQQRRAAARRLRRHRRTLWPNLAKRGRRVLADGRRALPPISRDAVGLWGRRLRAACRKLLGSAREPLSLTDLHAMLHRQGFFIDSGHPVKALADALRYEVLEGRARRVARGVYSPVSSRAVG